MPFEHNNYLSHGIFISDNNSRRYSLSLETTYCASLIISCPIAFLFKSRIIDLSSISQTFTIFHGSTFEDTRVCNLKALVGDTGQKIFNPTEIKPPVGNTHSSSVLLLNTETSYSPSNSAF